MNRFVTLTLALLVAAAAAPLWSQEEAVPPFAGEMEALALQYALQHQEKEQAKLSGEEQAQIRNEVRSTVQQMLRLGYGQPQISQAVMEGLREALQARAGLRAQAGEGTGVGDLLRVRLQDQLRTAEHAGVQIHDRDRDQLRTGRPDVAGPPGGGPGGPSGGGTTPE